MGFAVVQPTSPPVTTLSCSSGGVTSQLCNFGAYPGSGCPPGLNCEAGGCCPPFVQPTLPTIQPNIQVPSSLHPSSRMIKGVSGDVSQWRHLHDPVQLWDVRVGLPWDGAVLQWGLLQHAQSHRPASRQPGFNLLRLVEQVWRSKY